MAVVKLFEDPTVAVNAIRELQSRGIKASDIGIAVKSGDASELVSRRGEVALSAKVEAEGIGAVALAGPVASGSTLEGLANIWGVPQETLFYYESGLQRGGVVISVQGEAKGAKAAMREADASQITWTDPATNDRPFYLCDRATKSDERDKLFSGDFRKY